MKKVKSVSKKSTSSLTKDGRHKFKWLEYEGRKVRIDKDIAPLLSNMWKLGIKTAGSCQGNCPPKCHKWKTIKYKDGSTYFKTIKTDHCKSRIWVVFETAADYTRFLNYVAQYTVNKRKKNYMSMYERIVGCEAQRYSYFKKHQQAQDIWIYDFYVDNLGIEPVWKRGKAPQSSGLKKGASYSWYEDGDCKKNKFNIQPQLWIPYKHLKYVEDRIELALQKKK